ncbi:zinc finger protein 384-like [Syngnathus typhle]|uniref:zinc finger protein 384-like n=1 Tax=Syngnathus typhle TaxID=161592 RepID=UPI002A6AD493|nr:zinc finger protein 384-like [Syngnathus typhle]
MWEETGVPGENPRGPGENMQTPHREGRRWNRTRTLLTVRRTCYPRIMEDSHFNSSYFWSPIPTMSGQLENAVFLNKVKEQQEKSASFPPHSAPHYQTTLLGIPTPGGKAADGGGQPGGAAHLHPPHSSQNITVLPVPSTGIMTAAGLVITTTQGTLVSPTSSPSFVSAHPTTTMIQKSFRQLSHLQQHNRIHTGDRPYKCTNPGCEKSFTQLSNLQSHRRQHNKDKPYKCPNCNKGYVDAASLEVHMSKHTVKHARIYSCGLCNRTYTSETYLVKHMEKHGQEQLNASDGVAAAQHSQGQAAHAQPRARSRAEGSEGVEGRAGRGQGGYGQPNAIPCPFDLHQYKTVSTGDIQYKPIGVSDVGPHKDLCLTVTSSGIQVEHLNS